MNEETVCEGHNLYPNVNEELVFRGHKLDMSK